MAADPGASEVAGWRPKRRAAVVDLEQVVEGIRVAGQGSGPEGDMQVVGLQGHDLGVGQVLATGDDPAAELAADDRGGLRLGDADLCGDIANGGTRED